jgi:hypothetical protein
MQNTHTRCMYVKLVCRPDPQSTLLLLAAASSTHPSSRAAAAAAAAKNRQRSHPVGRVICGIALHTHPSRYRFIEHSALL